MATTLVIGHGRAVSPPSGLPDSEIVGEEEPERVLHLDGKSKSPCTILLQYILLLDNSAALRLTRRRPTRRSFGSRWRSGGACGSERCGRGKRGVGGAGRPEPGSGRDTAHLVQIKSFYRCISESAAYVKESLAAPF